MLILAALVYILGFILAGQGKVIGLLMCWLVVAFVVWEYRGKRW